MTDLKRCSFETERLLVAEWRSLPDEKWDRRDLALVVREILTGPVVRHLPPTWSSIDSDAAAGRWIEERDAEGTTLLAIDRESRSPAGLVILFVTVDEGSGAGELRIGYMLAESAWGRGLASELVGGLVRWARENGVEQMVGGVERENAASCKVLAKNGFVPDASADETAELMYRLVLSPSNDSDTPERGT